MRRYEEPLNKYVYLNDLLCTNERLFYKLLSENVEELMPIVYTPTVGLACQKFGYIFSKPQVNIFANFKKHKFQFHLFKGLPSVFIFNYVGIFWCVFLFIFKSMESSGI